MPHCVYDPDCEFGLHALGEIPCGHYPEEPGTPCRYCGDPVPLNGDSCPNCWTVPTLPALKAMFAPYGLSVDIAD